MQGETLITVELTKQEAEGLRMAVRWGVPVPMPPELRSAVSKVANAEAAAEGVPRVAPR